MPKSKSINKPESEVNAKEISAKANNKMTMSETYVRPQHNCETPAEEK